MDVRKPQLLVLKLRLVVLATTYSRGTFRPTTIGANAFHFQVRNGAGWFHIAVATREGFFGDSLGS